MEFYHSIIKPINKAIVPRRYRWAVRRSAFRVRSWVYVGNRVTCPFCGGCFRKFLPYGVKRNPDSECPRCSSKPRQRLLWLYLKNRTNLFSAPLRLLHIAPEYEFRKALSALPNLDYVSVDLDSLKAMAHADITSLPFGEIRFDAVLCSHVLEHVLEDRKAMSELHRVLKPGGWAIIQVPVDSRRATTFEDPDIVSPEDRERFFLQKDHVRIYGCDYTDRLEAAGFTVNVVHYARELPDDLRMRYGLRRKRPIYHCIKPSSAPN